MLFNLPFKQCALSEWAESRRNDHCVVDLFCKTVCTGTVTENWLYKRGARWIVSRSRENERERPRPEMEGFSAGVRNLLLKGGLR